jgi:hypothetical protein
MTPPITAATEPACRVLRLSGSARRGSEPLTANALLRGEEWLSLDDGTSLTLKHSTSGRELSLEGPARVRACQRGREQILLTRGKLHTTATTGARPGAEVLIATPAGAVRYADAELELDLSAKRLRLDVLVGRADFEPAGGGAKSLGPKQKLNLPVVTPDAASSMQRCREAAEAAQNAARRVGEHGSSESLGERAQAHVRARKAARSACTIAAAATGLAADPAEQARLWDEAARWEALWESFPKPVRGASSSN